MAAADSAFCSGEPAAGLGVLNAPVDSCCNLSKISWSSFGRRGGAGPVLHADLIEVDVANERRVKPGRIPRTALAADCIVRVGGTGESPFKVGG